MEKYSAYRDPGTGIQPFLYPVPPQGSNSLAIVIKPALFLIGLARTALILLFTLLYLVLVQVFCTFLIPIRPLYNLVAGTITSLILRLCLFISGLYWIPVQVVRRKRGRSVSNEKISIKAGDVIVSNWISWLEIAWLAFRFNPIFLLPVFAPESIPSLPSPGINKKTRKEAKGYVGDPPSQSSKQPKRAEIRGFTEVSFLQLINRCGLVPPRSEGNYQSLEQVRMEAKKAGRPLVIFPECTTSNGRGLLRFANVFKGESIPPKMYNIFIMCVRINPPTHFSPSISLPIPSSISVNPIPHIFSICCSLTPHELSVRFLSPSESPSSDTFIESDFSSGIANGDDALTEICAVLMSDIGRLKRTGMGWEDKSLFLEFYKGKNSR